MALFLKNADYVDYQTFEIRNTHLKVNEGNNATIEFLKELPAEATQAGNTVIDCTNRLVTKSFACGHNHIYSALARGMNPPKKNPLNFYENLKYVWWTLDKSLDKEMVSASAYAAAMSCAKNGVTFCIDHHASPNYILGSLDVIAEAFEKVGVQHLLCYEITDRDGMDRAEQGLQETENYLKHHQALVGLHASFTVSNETLKSAVALAEKTNSGIHVHVAEDKYDQYHCIINYGQRAIERLNDAGALQFSKTILGHCLFLSDNEREIIKNSPVYVVANVESNLNNAVGIFNPKGLSDNIMLGTDGMHNDMLRSSKSAFLIARMYEDIDYFTPYKRFRNVHKYLSQNNFKGDGDNNLVVLNYDSPTPQHANNFLGHFFFGWESKHVQHVISNGKLIVKDAVLQTVDENEILKFTKTQAERLWKKMSE